MSEKLSTSSLENNRENLPPLERFRVNEDDYPIFQNQYELNNNNQSNERIYWNIDKTVGEHIKSTADLIATMDGTSMEYEMNQERVKPDHVIYLDKSARPVSWLVNTFWNDFSEEKRPEHSYLNIDRLTWFRRAGVDVDANGYIRNSDGSQRIAMPKDFHIEDVSPEDFARIRSLYLPNGIENEDVEEIMRMPSLLDGKNVLIVDEVKRSGSTNKIASDLIKAAFPEVASVNTAYYWDSGTKILKSGEAQMLSIPVWYDSKSSLGRGIGDIDPEYFRKRHEKFQTPRTRAQNFGSIVLGAYVNLNEEKGQLSRELMREIQQMHQDYQDGKILVRVPKNYDDDRAEEFIESQGLRLLPQSDKSPDNYIKVVQAINERSA